MKTGAALPSISENELRQGFHEIISNFYAPGSVYRLQLHKDFTFRQAESILSYLKNLGVESVYCSPYLQAVAGSMHGYNVINPQQINSEIGSDEDFKNFCRALHKNDLRQILDVVPNHMGVSTKNPWWKDVLENGPASLFANFFDINWEPVKKELRGKILLPVLGDAYGVVLENQEIQLRYGQGEFYLQYYQHEWPVAPDTFPMILLEGLEELSEKLNSEDSDLQEYLSITTALNHLPSREEKDPEKKAIRNREKEVTKKRLKELIEKSSVIRSFVESRLQRVNGKKGSPQSFDWLHRFLNEQSYRLAYWRVAGEEINYRRFFNINELVAIRTEDPEVFEEYHRLIFRLIREGNVQGLRIDHPDGLYDPPEYFRRLQKQYLFYEILKKGKYEENSEAAREVRSRLSELLKEKEFLNAKPLHVVAEKILESKETLPENWNLHGTVGYDFLAQLNNLFVQSENEKTFTEIYQNFIGHPIDFQEAVNQKKKFFALVQMANEVNELGDQLDRISEKNRRWRDFTRNNLTLALREIIAAFPVYRTYISPTEPVSVRDQKYIHIAIEKAKRKTPDLDPLVYEFIKKVLLLDFDGIMTPEEEKSYRHFVLKFQQLTGPVMAKGLEDTVFYLYNRLISLNEVGADPISFGMSPEEFHRRNQERNKRWPFSLITTSTHDTKRSEDVRMRINVLSEMPSEWKIQTEKWAILNEKHKTLIQDTLEPRRNTEYFIYQTLIGAWPLEAPRPQDFSSFHDRLWQYFLKASREAMVHTSWTHPREEYEKALKKFLTAIISPSPENKFLMEFIPFQKKIAAWGLWNSVSALTLKLGSPGIMDTYQGTEIWTDSLVDPDNRRPVDYFLRQQYLEQIRTETLESLLQSRADGRLKMFLLWKGLHARKKQKDLFLGAEYIPLKITGAKKNHAAAFLRKQGKHLALAASGRFFSQLQSNSEEIPAGKIWEDTAVILTEGEEEMIFTNLFTSQEIRTEKQENQRIIRLSEMFSRLPAAILLNEKDVL